jgi:hypothetical protein
VTWHIGTGSGRLEVLGPSRDVQGTIVAVSCEQQRAWARGLGARLPTAVEFDEMWRTADVRVTPKPRDVTKAPLDALHGDAVAAGARADQRIALGKTWLHSVDGSVVNYGWHVPIAEVMPTQGVPTWRGIKVYLAQTGRDAYVIQPPGKAHGATHVDYSQIGYAVRAAPGTDDDHDTDPAPTSLPLPPESLPPPWDVRVDMASFRLGERIVAWLGHEYGRGDVREIRGVKHNPRILGYSAMCRRGGRLLGVYLDGSPNWLNGSPLPLGTDEDPWCAAARSAALLACLLPNGPPPPHGLRVSVRELCEDARAAGTLHVEGDGYDPLPGDAAILGRSGESPLNGGRGHVRTVVQPAGLDYSAIGGNEGDELSYGEHPRELVLCWIACG